MFAGRPFQRLPALAAALLCAVLAAPGFSQPREPEAEAEGLPPVMMAVPPSRETLQALQAARDALKQDRLADAIQLLERLIELPEDYFTDKTMRQTLKSETLDILEKLSPENQEAYEVLQGTQAKSLLDEAVEAGDFEKLADVSRRFPLTAASLDAAELLAARALDHGHVWQAAAEFGRLRRSPAVSAELARRFMLREALAWHYAGQNARAAELLQELSSQQPGFRAEVAGQPLPAFGGAEQAKRWLAQLSRTRGSAAALASAEWLSARGSIDGSAAASFSAPIGGPMWSAGLFAASDQRFASAQNLLSRLLAETKELLDDSEQLNWSTAMPLIVGDAIVVRTVRDIVALDRRTGDVRWRSVLADADFERLLAKTLQAENPAELEADLTAYLRERLFEDRSFGSLSSDGRLVFALEGQELLSAGERMNPANNPRFFVQTRNDEPEPKNRLVAYDVPGGRLAWEIGGDRREAKEDDDFADHDFLGPPLADNGHLFVLAEVQGEIRLLMLDASVDGVKKLWSQPLVAPTLKIADSLMRRRQAFIPAISNGLVICPTGAGVVIAVDPAGRRLVWAYPYQSTDQSAMFAAAARGGFLAGTDPGMMGDESDQGWFDGNPVVADGRVFLTPTDSEELHCVNLTDGSLHWSIPRDRAVSLAGADAQRAVLISPDRIDAVDAATGRPAWKEPLMIAAPTGRGVWMEGRYSLPLSTGEIATLDLVQGRLLARSRIPNGRLPGNLAAGSGGLISVSGETALAFRADADVEQIITQKLAADPKNAAALALRGERRLHQGDFDAGLADLRASIAGDPQPYVKSVLTSALLEGLRTDFDRYRDTLAELDRLTDDPQQRSEFLWLAARGLKDGGNRVAAFERMTHLIDQSLDAMSSEGTGGPWQSRNDRRLTAYFADLYRESTAAEREQLDAQILARLPKPNGLPDDERIAGLRRFLRAFGFHPSATGARQQLVAVLNPEANDLEYVQELSRLARQSDAAIAAPAAAKLAAWFLKRQRFNDVETWLLLLEDRFAAAECEPGVSGRDYAAKLREDENFQESRKRSGFVPWPEGEIDKEYVEQPQQGSRMIRVPIAEPVPAAYDGWSFETDQQGQILIARDQQARYRWSINRNLADRSPAAMLRDFQPALHRVHLSEHLVGWSTGSEFLIAADLEADGNSPRLLWQESLLPPGGAPTGAAGHMAMMRQLQRLGARRAMINPPFVFNVPAFGGGALVALTDSAVIYHNGRKLMAADPLTGKLQWSRKDLSASLLDVNADDAAVAVQDRTGEFAAEPDQRGSSVSLLRTVDGQRLKKTASPKGFVEWIGGSRTVQWELAPGAVALGVYDVAGNKPVWETKLARPAAIRVVNQAEIFTIEENRRLTVRRLDDGAVEWSQNLTLPVAVETLIVQRWQDRYLVIAGSSTPEPGGVRALGLSHDNHHLPIAGSVAALKRDTGELLWETPINDPATDPTAFDAAQPAGWPVLLFAGQLWAPPPPGGVPQPARRLTVTFIDKRTGKREYFAEQASQASLYFVDIDPERNRMSANFMNWALNLHYIGKHRK